MTPFSLERFFPFLGWQRPTRQTLRDDLFAGITVALLVIPQSLAYAQLAGVPAHYGLYAALVPAIVGVLFGSSAILSTGPVALTSLLTAASVRQIAPAGTEPFIASVMLLALLSGVFQIGLGVARAGILLNLLSHPVLVGFINAAALVIAMSQLPALTGISVPQDGGVLLATWKLLGQLSAGHGTTLAFGSLAIAILILFRRFAPKRPGVLVMAAILTLLSLVTDFAGHGGAIVGSIPAGLPGLSIPAMSWDATIALVPAAAIISLVSFMEAMSSCKVIAIKTRTRWDENQELIGQGLAKVAAAFCHSMPVSGSFSRSALNLASHARSGYSSLFTTGFVLVTLVAFTPLLYHLPKPALAAIIVMALFNLIDVAGMRNAWRASTDDGIAATLAFVATLAFAPNIQNGILAGIVFSLGAFMYRRMVPRFAILRLRDGVLADIGTENSQRSGETVGVLRFDAALFFANASFFEDAVLKLQRENPGLKYVVVLANGINLLDASGVEVLRSLVRHLRESGVTLIISNAKQQFLDVAARTGLTEEIGHENFFDRDDLAFSRVREPSPVPTPPQ
jgi:sulfate permease, SulP family